MTPKNLIQKAKDAQKEAIAPYSNFNVGAALLTKSGKVYSGINIESSSYSLTICAERVALFKALSEGERDFDSIAIVTDADELCPPCGACRQVLWDFAPDLKVILANKKGDVKEYELRELFPAAFDQNFLDR
ncbi:MAG: cytidine deaminase [Calditrichaeota bacterium]|nr:cytidine deaminase [Calditrichota bacterium]